MALVIPINCFQVTVPLANSNLQRAAAVTFGINSEGYEGTTVELADDITTAFATGFDTTLDPNVTIGPSSLFSYDGGTSGGSVEGSYSVPGARATTNSIPPQVAVIFRKVTNRLGRPGRGRFFLPWAVDRDDVQEDGNIASTELAGLQSNADDFLTALTAIDVGLVLLHNEGIPGSTAPTTVTALNVQARSGTQGRRNRR